MTGSNDADRPAEAQSRPPLHSTPYPTWMRDKQPTPQPPAGGVGLVGRHCWVFPPRESTLVPKAGLLLEWRKTGEEYEGLVVYLADLAGGRPLTQVQEWLAARHLRPAQ